MTSSETYTTSELMAVCCAREIKNGEVVFIGIGLPMIAAQVAQATFAGDSIFIYETGGVGADSSRIPVSVMDNPTTERAIAVLPMWRIFGDAQAGFIDRGVMGGAQIDKYGNINSTVIGDYNHPKVRLAGSGGANDLGSSCGEVTIVITLKKNNFVKQLDFLTTVGHLTGGDSRREAGLLGRGPTSVITQKGVFRFEPDTKEMYLSTIFPGVTVDEIKSLIPWELKISAELAAEREPEAAELNAIRLRDPSGLLLYSKRKINETFDEFYANGMKK